MARDGVGSRYDEMIDRESAYELLTRRAEEIAAATGSVIVDVRGGVIILTDKRTWDSQCQKKSDN